MITTGTQVRGGPPPVTSRSETQSYYILFDADSSSFTSHIINVAEFPVVITAYNLVSPEVVDVYRVTTVGVIQYSTPVFIQGQQIQLTDTNNVLVLNISGLYQFKLSAGLGSVVVVAQDANLVDTINLNAIIGD